MNPIFTMTRIKFMIRPVTPNYQSAISASLLQYEDSLYAFAFSSTLVENDDFNTWDDSFLQAPLIDFVSQLKNAFEVEDDVFVAFPQLELVFAEDSTYCEQFCLEHLMALWSSLQLQLSVKSEPLHLRVVCQKSSLQRQIDFLSSL
ncbi:hypothetical protein HDU81_002917 [Chytriomyces hyalinus]|nr:hypothetical protein HDU81_002917 [Chytriomyces hyalinus]